MRRPQKSKQLSAPEERQRDLKRSAVAGVLVLIVLGVIEYRDWSESKLAEPTAAIDTGPVIAPVASVFAEHRKTDPTYPLPGFIAKQLPSGSYQSQREKLMARAAIAVETDSRLELGNQLALLGAASLSENDLASSRVYLDEALSVYEEQDDLIGIGSVELLRGRVETVARENARDASAAHDVMQIAAWMIVKGRFAESEIPLQSAIDENLRLNRFGAAASGFEMLERGYASVGDSVNAMSAAKEALRLHAASGRVDKAREVLTTLENEGLSALDVDELNRTINLAEVEYDNSINEIGRARDYEQLYRRLVNAGDPVQAWQFRQKANDSLAQASKRAMHRRQTGVIALLYNSNENRQAARNSLARAREIFASESRDDMVDHIDAAEQLIW